MKEKKEDPHPIKPFTYRERHAIIIEVETEKEQKALFDKLKSEGHKKIKVVSV